MAISHLSIVNQKFVHAGTLLGLASTLKSPTSTSQRLQLRALLDSTILHLGLAYVFYLRELGENYRIKNLDQIDLTSQLVSALAGANKSPSEAQELISLEQDVQSWLHHMLSAHAALRRSPEPEKVKKAFPVDGLISIVDISDSAEPVSAAGVGEITAWLTEFRALVLRQRDTSAEF